MIKKGAVTSQGEGGTVARDLHNGSATPMRGKSLTCRTERYFKGVSDPLFGRLETARFKREGPASPRLAVHRRGGAMAQVARHMSTILHGRGFFLACLISRRANRRQVIDICQRVQVVT